MKAAEREGREEVLLTERHCIGKPWHNLKTHGMDVAQVGHS